MNAITSNRPTADDEAQLLEAIERWVEKEVRPIARKMDQADEYPHDLVEQMKELGLFGATIAPEYGGLGLSATGYARIVTAIAKVWMAPTGIFNSHLIMAQCVERAGTPEQKAFFLPKFASGEWRGGRVRFNGQASAAPGQEAALGNLLNIIGRRQGAVSVITIG